MMHTNRQGVLPEGSSGSAQKETNKFVSYMRSYMQRKKRFFIAVFILIFLGMVFTTDEAYAKTSPLHVDGVHLKDQNGKTVVLRGVSLHGLSWFPEYVNKGSFKSVKKLFKANVLRLPVYTTNYNGYCSGGDQKELRKVVEKGVKYATKLGMYVIIDWHILDDNDPNTHIDESKKFFKYFAKKYADHDNVLYEICNEPHGVSWHDSIKPYAKKITKVIRAYDDDAIIIVGTNTWSQDVDDVIGDTLPDKNTVYALHFYAATHGDFLREKAQKAIDNNIPIFVSECSICEASGNGNVDTSSGKKWKRFLDKNKISMVAWNLSNKDEASSLIKSTCKKLKGWKKKNLTKTGKWFRKNLAM